MRAHTGRQDDHAENDLVEIQGCSGHNASTSCAIQQHLILFFSKKKRSKRGLSVDGPFASDISEGAGAELTSPQDKHVIMADAALRAKLEAITVRCKEHVKAFLQWELLPPAENAFEQRMMLSLGK